MSRPTPVHDATGPTRPPTTPARAQGSAHAKAILLGEHAAVYGAPALAVPLPALTCRAEVTARHGGARGLVGLSCTADPQGVTAPVSPPPPGLVSLVAAVLRRPGAAWLHGVDVELSSTIPPARGLGASAASARALTRALDRLLGARMSETEVFAHVQLAERAAHGRPSGIDALATGSAAPVLLREGRTSTPRVGTEAWLVVADSGTPGSTHEAVAGLRLRFETGPLERERFLSASTTVVDRGLTALADGDLEELGRCLTEAHHLLSALGLSTAGLDSLVTTALEHSALGAKLTGGGLGGCMIALSASRAASARLAALLTRRGAHRAWTARVEAGGPA
ncbi:mevalonate kinase [Kitasatospora albolonga]|uniref:mevalonate kinase n=1 Tax=Kitasatospora albolonga TaxID=68173 RepID=UPI0035EAEDE5